MLQSFPAYSIHLKDRIDRKPMIKNLQEKLGIPIHIFNASDGSEWWNNKAIPKKHPWAHDTITKGMVGCAYSHIALLKQIYESNEYGVLIFEDDAELVQSPDALKGFINQVKLFNKEETHGLRSITDREWHILLLGANEYVSSRPITHEIQRVNRFWGTHAICIKKHIIPDIIEVFEKYLSNGIFLPPDWLYNKVIEEKKYIVYGPSQPRQYIQQAVGVVSSITGKTRL